MTSYSRLPKPVDARPISHGARGQPLNSRRYYALMMKLRQADTDGLVGGLPHIQRLTPLLDPTLDDDLIEIDLAAIRAKAAQVRQEEFA